MSKHPAIKQHYRMLHSINGAATKTLHLARDIAESTTEPGALPNGNNCGLPGQTGLVRANRSNWLSQVFMHGLADMRLCTPSVAPFNKPSA